MHDRCRIGNKGQSQQATYETSAAGWTGSPCSPFAVPPSKVRRTTKGVEMAYIDRDGVKVYYEVEGSGPPVLLSHGYSATSRMWQGQAEALKDRYQVITWDMRG